MCDCIKTLDAKLKDQGVGIWATIPLTGGPSVALIPLIRLDKHEIETRRNKPKMVAATYCPWCGERYQDVAGRKVA